MSTQQLWALHDYAPLEHPGGMRRVAFKDAEAMNRLGFGIFITVNNFNGRFRRIADLARINAWAIDIDDGEKTEQLKRLYQRLPPSIVVETKRGYHAYWVAKDATVANWKAIVEDRLVPFYNADPNAKDLARVLRMPGYYHMKDPADPFLVKIIEKEPSRIYTEDEMLSCYKPIKPLKRKFDYVRQIRESAEGYDSIDCVHALICLSGTDYVNNEVYDFTQNSNGKLNLKVNGKGTSVFIDQNGLIGSSDRGGPTILQWLKWYGHERETAVEIIKNVLNR